MKKLAESSSILFMKLSRSAKVIRKIIECMHGSLKRSNEMNMTEYNIYIITENEMHVQDV